MASNDEYVCYDEEEDDDYGPALVDGSEEYELEEIEDATSSNVNTAAERSNSGIEQASRLNSSIAQSRTKKSKPSRQDSCNYDLPDLSDNDSSTSPTNLHQSTSRQNNKKVGKNASMFTNKCLAISIIVSSVSVIVTIVGISVYMTRKQEGNIIH